MLTGLKNFKKKKKKKNEIYHLIYIYTRCRNLNRDDINNYSDKNSNCNNINNNINKTNK